MRLLDAIKIAYRYWKMPKPPCNEAVQKEATDSGLEGLVISFRGELKEASDDGIAIGEQNKRDHELGRTHPKWRKSLCYSCNEAKDRRRTAANAKRRIAKRKAAYELQHGVDNIPSEERLRKMGFSEVQRKVASEVQRGEIKSPFANPNRIIGN